MAAKKFLDQDLTGEALEEFRSEVRAFILVVVFLLIVLC